MTNPIWREKCKYYEGRDNWHGSVQRDNINRLVDEIHVRRLCIPQLWFSFLNVFGSSLTVFWNCFDMQLAVQLRLKYTHPFGILMTPTFFSRQFFREILFHLSGLHLPKSGQWKEWKIGLTTRGSSSCIWTNLKKIDLYSYTFFCCL